MTRPCENNVRRIAGIVTLLGIALAWMVHNWLIGISVFAGLNLVQSSFTGICPAERLLPACDDIDNT